MPSNYQLSMYIVKNRVKRLNSASPNACLVVAHSPGDVLITFNICCFRGFWNVIKLINVFYSFRPCAMVVPDFELICEIMLVAEGFIEARLLARKFITLYTLCKELLSKQVYMWYEMNFMYNSIEMNAYRAWVVHQIVNNTR